MVSIIWVQTPIAQLLKLGTLAEHYLEHKHTNKTLNIAEFLYIHYVSNHHSHTGGDKGRELPFKQCSPISLLVTVLASPIHYFSQRVSNFTGAKQLLHYQSPYHAAETFAKIWQPPRI